MGPVGCGRFEKDKEVIVSIITVGSTASLEAALGHAHAGDTIQLQAGQYDGLVIKYANFSGVTITSADPSHPAVISAAASALPSLPRPTMAKRVQAEGPEEESRSSSRI